jgi:hypothetical protein
MWQFGSNVRQQCGTVERPAKSRQLPPPQASVAAVADDLETAIKFFAG